MLSDISRWGLDYLTPLKYSDKPLQSIPSFPSCVTRGFEKTKPMAARDNKLHEAGRCDGRIFLTDTCREAN
ncbi:hypothetical protein RRG08_034303 [Elysia crispata]|uniref:Uncharacterized protein n=1 Tax=Elysia crispata TaxID=231223 RepID=A0AAE1AHE8_9GAST|nr:hypothetical protein RRG08_034303 [Elysia crispata]